MKKLTFSLLACFAISQAHAIIPTTTPFNASLQQFEAITTTLRNNPDFLNVIPESEYITEIKIDRRSLNVTEGNVFVHIITRMTKNDEVVILEEGAPNRCQGFRHGHTDRRTTKHYKATLVLSPSETGSPTIAVAKVEPITWHSKKLCKELTPATTKE